MEELEAEARSHDLCSIFAFTYVDRFFRKLGFEEVDRGELPLKAWKDCLRCPKFQACDEIAMLKRLRPGAPTAALAHLNQVTDSAPLRSEERRVGKECRARRPLELRKKTSSKNSYLIKLIYRLNSDIHNS